MNKSNEWHVIIEQGARDGQRAGASGRKPEIICLENLRKSESRYVLTFSFVCGSAVLRVCAGRSGSDHSV